MTIWLSLGVEIVLAVSALSLLLVGLALPAKIATRIVSHSAVILLLSMVAVLLWAQGQLPLTFTNDHDELTSLMLTKHFHFDAFALYIKILILFSSACVLVIGLGFIRSEPMRKSLYRFEYVVIILLATLGMCLMVSAQSLLALYVGLELQSLALYIAAALQRDNLRSSEAGLKYFMLGALSSGLLLFGCSLLYGSAESIEFAGILASLENPNHPAPTMLLIGMVLTLSAIAFKISAVPFHMWTPDVYEGAPSSIVAFFATASKIAALALLMRLLVEAFLPLLDDWRPIISILAVASMFVGALATIPQTNIKRFVAYSAIAHIGIILIGFASATPESMRAVLFYLCVYMTMSLGLFAFILAMRSSGEVTERMQDLAGLARSDAKAALALSVLMFSMAGLPPFIGFFAKFYIFLAALRTELVVIALCGALASVISAFYYIRIVKIMYFDDAQENFVLQGVGNRWVLYASAIAVVGLTLAPSILLERGEQAIRALFAS